MNNITLEDRLWRIRNLAGFLSRTNPEKFCNSEEYEKVKRTYYPEEEGIAKSEFKEKYFNAARKNLDYQISQLSNEEKSRIKNSIVKKVGELDTSGISKSYQINLGNKDIDSFEEDYSGALATFSGEEAGAYSTFSGKFSALGSYFDGKEAGRRSRFIGEGSGNHSSFVGNNAGEYTEFAGRNSGKWARFIGESAGNRVEFKGENSGENSLFRGYMAGKHSQFHECEATSEAIFEEDSAGKFIEFYGSNDFIIEDPNVYSELDNHRSCKLDWRYRNCHGYDVSVRVR